MVKPACCACSQAASDPPTDTGRRRVVQIAAAGVAAPWLLGASPAHATPAAGDLLVEEDAEGAPAPLRLADLKPGKPLLAYPLDAQLGKPKADSRLNKLVLIRLAEADMTPETRARSAGGVLAYSAICTHQSCDVKTWVSKENALVCFCHSSKFALLDSAAVLSGPAARPLPSVPLKLEGDRLVVAGPFSAKPGAAS